MPGKNQVQDSLRRSLSGLKENPYLAEQIIANPVRSRKKKKKTNGAILISFVLVGIMTTAAAAGMIIRGEPLGVLRWISDSRPSVSETSMHISEQIIFPSADYSWNTSEAINPEKTTGDVTLNTRPAIMDSATITIQEATTDGYGIYLSILAEPKDPGILLLNNTINPFEDTPETIGQLSDYEDQKIAEWAVVHGFQELIRISVHSPSSEPYTNGRLLSSVTYDPETNDRHIAQIDTFENDRISSGANFDSFHNAKMLLEEDGSSLIMIAGGYIPQESYEISCTLIPWRTTADGKPDPYVRDIPSSDENDSLLDFNFVERGTVTLSFPSPSDTSVSMLAEYYGTTPFLIAQDASATVHVQFLQTLLNDYCIVTCNDSSRIYEGITVFLDEDQTTQIKNSKLFVSTYQLLNDEIVFTQSCEIPDYFPSRIYVRWDDYEYDMTQNAMVFLNSDTE